jgi:hypothetical protein
MIFLYFIGKSIINKRLEKQIIYAGIIGPILSLLWWVPMIIKHKGISGIAGAVGVGSATTNTSSPTLISGITGLLDPASGTASRAYTFNDFFIAKSQNMINNPIGIGIFITILLVIALVYILIKYKSLFDKENTWKLITFMWLVFAFLGVNSITFNLPIGLVAFRFWMLLAIPVSLLASEGMWLLKNLFKKFGIPSLLIFLIIISGVYFTSVRQKYEVNTSIWGTYPYYGGGNPQLAIEYSNWFSTLPKNTAVFTYSDRNHVIAGFDMYSCAWCDEVMQTTKACILDLDEKQLNSFLKKYQYEYMLIGSSDFKYIGAICGENRTQTELPQKIQAFASSDLFEPVYQKENLFVAFKIK